MRLLCFILFVILFALLLPLIGFAAETDIVGMAPDQVSGTLMTYAVSTLGTLALGWIQKHKTPVPNKAIPITNPVIAGGVAAGVTQDPVATGASILGALTAWGLHQLGKRVFK